MKKPEPKKLITQTPADVVTKVLGVRGLARSLELHPSTVMRWKNSGRIPSEYHVNILLLSNGKLTSDDLVYGR